MVHRVTVLGQRRPSVSNGEGKASCGQRHRVLCAAVGSPAACLVDCAEDSVVAPARCELLPGESRFMTAKPGMSILMLAVAGERGQNKTRQESLPAGGQGMNYDRSCQNDRIRLMASARPRADRWWPAEGDAREAGAMIFRPGGDLRCGARHHVSSDGCPCRCGPLPTGGLMIESMYLEWQTIRDPPSLALLLITEIF